MHTCMHTYPIGFDKAAVLDNAFTLFGHNAYAYIYIYNMYICIYMHTQIHTYIPYCSRQSRHALLCVHALWP